MGKKGKKKRKHTTVQAREDQIVETIAVLLETLLTPGPEAATKAAVMSAEAYMKDIRECGCGECLLKAADWAARGRGYLANPNTILSQMLSDLQKATVGAALDQLESAIHEADKKEETWRG